MELDQWAPGAWRFLHAVTFAYPDEPSFRMQKQAKLFFGTLGDILPCKKCGHHWNQRLENHPVPTQSKDALSRWLVNVHNDINRSNNKREFSYDEVCEIYDPDCNRCETKRPFPWTTIMIVLLIVAALVWYMQSR